MAKDSASTDPVRSTSPADSAHETAVHRYEPSGILERSGHIPIWLTVVVFGLILWGLYYGVRYWSSY
jgi:hypothetical protein